jgi:hypothetical protein
MKVLIDGIEGVITNSGHLIGKDIYGRDCKVADHGYVLNTPYEGKDNFKVITSGHVYVLNYNPNTFKNSKPRTFEEYREMESNGEKLNFK